MVRITADCCGSVRNDADERSPKAEGRTPKETRRPRSKVRPALATGGCDGTRRLERLARQRSAVLCGWRFHGLFLTLHVGRLFNHSTIHSFISGGAGGHIKALYSKGDQKR